MVISLLVVFIYGGIVWGVFPIKQEISWEGHLFGSIAGILVAFNYRREGPQRRIFVWPEEPEEDSESTMDWNISENKDEATLDNESPTIHVNFIYKKKDEETN